MPSTFKYQRYIWTLLSVAGLLLALYLMLMGSTMYNTMLAQRYDKDAASMTAELASMEFKYLSAQADLTLDVAISMGFEEPKSMVVAKVPESGATAFVAKDKI